MEHKIKFKEFLIILLGVLLIASVNTNYESWNEIEELEWELGACENAIDFHNCIFNEDVFCYRTSEKYYIESCKYQNKVVFQLENKIPEGATITNVTFIPRYA